MEFLNQNFLLTSTSIVVDSNTATAEFIIDRDPVFQYVSDNFNDDTTTTTLTINFDQTQSVGRIALLSHNLQSYTIYYDGVTANTFSMTSTADTTTTDYSTNSSTSQYLSITPQDCTSVSIDMKQTIVANSEKAIGYLVISNCLLEFERLPPAQGYSPNLISKNVEHRLSNGGTRIQTLDENWDVQIRYDHITQTFRDNLRTIFDLHKDMIFVPFGTSSSWGDEIIFPCVWAGPFNFYRHSDNAVSAGFSGSLSIKETPR